MLRRCEMDRLVFLSFVPYEEVADILVAVDDVVGVEKPTVKKFNRELAKLRDKNETLPELARRTPAPRTKYEFLQRTLTLFPCKNIV